MIMRRERGILVVDSKKFNMLLRISSALVIGPVFIIAIMFFTPLFYLLIILIAIGMLYEWYQMTKSSINYILFGFIILPIPIISLIILATNDQNRWLLLLYFTIIWAVDSFAMIGGKLFKGPKLIPKISPNKTWSGLIIGISGAGLSAFLLSLLAIINIDNYYFLDKYQLVTASMLLALIAQISDLFISYFKRKFAIKDSGSIIPGHGGVLDRFDSIILTAPLLSLSRYYELFIFN